ncbi:diguanylate cyclase domain-containing protein [Mesorhizobium helmanticense]|uniref:Sensor domain-containing diguanylate cyclase n=1 Tax=Mesorhizobium helmanticense TaxID=1776423 RepID=A0A2T4IU04_9HYPH|nr:diguanylate cyclase [Mesorhizobium helmanticense]PTE09132.1 sensor domain-containing diguanylate cyclase [Mesorhizobium helmanticense]
MPKGSVVAVWQPLFANLAASAVMLVAWSSVGDFVARLSETRQRLLFGVVMTAGTVGSMMMAFEASPGVYNDFRGPMIAVTGLFGGVPAAVMAAGAALMYRLYLGGAVFSGVLGIMLATTIGLLGYALRRSRRIRYLDLVFMAAAVATLSSLLVLTLPLEKQAVLISQLWQRVLLAFVATLLLGVLLLQEMRRRELSVANQLFRSMVDALPDCLNIKGVDGRFLAANPATAKLMGAASADDLLGKTDFDFYPPELAKQFRDDELAVLREGKHASIEQPGIFANGSTGWLSTLKAPMTNDVGDVIGLITHNRDVTLRRTLQTKLEETQAYLDQALENMNDGLAMYDPDGVILFCNNRYRELFPLTAHLRKPGASFADIIRASVKLGEEPLGPRKSLDDRLAEKLATLREDGETLVELGDGRTFALRTKVLANGCTVQTISDVTERRSFEKSLERQALHDPLTGLPNRAFFNRELNRLVDKARSESGELVVMLLDLDRFKEVNDNFGHAVGDMLLVEIARRLEKAIRRGDMVARLGGDEFAVLMYGPTDGTGDVSLATRIMKNLSQPLKMDDVTLLPGGTIGYTVFPRDQADPEGLLKNADKALYQAKARGRGTWKAYDPNAVATTAARRG